MRRRSAVFPSSMVTDSVSFMVTLSVYHPITCSYCRGNGITGFRYRCLRCRGYQLCQNCFWRGNASGSHNNQHQMKEHSSWVSHWWPTHLSHQGHLCVCVHALGPQSLYWCEMKSYTMTLCKKKKIKMILTNCRCNLKNDLLHDSETSNWEVRHLLYIPDFKERNDVLLNR